VEHALAEYQNAFARALLADDPFAEAPPSLASLIAQPGFAIYRNTVLKGCIDALQANFPAVARLVGDEWFRAAAAIYARRELPSQPTLLTYGHRFADFLATFEPAAELPYLADVARVDHLWSEAHVAADDAVLAPAALVSLTAEAMTNLTLRPHAAARWAWFDQQPIYTIWSRNRDAIPNFVENAVDHAAPIDWHGEGVLLTRPHGLVTAAPLTRDGVAFLDACAAGQSIEHAVSATREKNANADLAALINQCLRAGAFGGLQPSLVQEFVR